MRFELKDTKGKPIHNGAAMIDKAPDIVTWGARAFFRVLTRSEPGSGEITVYREKSTYRIGK